MPRKPQYSTAADYFASRTNKTPGLGPDGTCWLWRGPPASSHGYGQFQWCGRMWLAHRAAWALANGPLPDSKSKAECVCVLHKCDVKLCVNPAHLSLGTHADNVRDKVTKGRGRCGRGKAKITPNDVLWIREWASVGWRLKDLAKAVKLSPNTVCAIVAGKLWKDVGQCRSM